MDETKKLGNEKIIRLLLNYSIPAIVGMLINAIYNIVDRIFIGNSPDLGSLGIGGITITFPIYIIIMGVAILFGSGGAVLFSIRLGEKKEKEAKKILSISTLLLIISSIVLTIIGIVFIDPILSFFGARGELFVLAKEYIVIILAGSIFQILSMGLSYFVRATGYPKAAMIAMLLGAITNIILDPIFIYVFKMGMFGAALATIIGQMLSTIWIVFYFIRKSHFKIELRHCKLEFHYVKLITAYGISAFIVQIAGSIVNIIINKLLIDYGGDVAVSGMGIVNSITTLVLLPVLGLIQGAQPIISYNHGANSKKRVFDTIKLCLIFSTVILIFCYIIILLFSEQIIFAFNQDPELIKFTKQALIIWLFALPVIGMQLTFSNYFQAVGKVKISIFLNMSRQILILTPCIVLFGKAWGLDGVLYAGPLSDFLAFILTLSFFIYEYRKYYMAVKAPTYD